MANYWTDLLYSFAPGGLTPLQALFDLDEGEGIWDYIEDTQNNSWINYPEAFVSAPESSSDPTPSDTSFSDPDTFLSELLDRINESVDKQNLSAQSSADRAMEFEAEQAQLDRDFQAAQAQKAMDYQTHMSNTSYQRAMADLKAAGINPKMVAQLGGASTPSGVVGSGAKASGHVASMSMSNISALSGLLQSYVTSSASMDNKDKDFVQQSLGDILDLISVILLSRGSSTGKIGF